MRLSSSVSEALEKGLPVVALESTVITHGLPRPDNLELARALEDEVRAGGAVPATIGIIRGEVVIGLSEDETALLSSTTFR